MMLVDIVSALSSLLHTSRETVVVFKCLKGCQFKWEGQAPPLCPAKKSGCWSSELLVALPGLLYTTPTAVSPRLGCDSNFFTEGKQWAEMELGGQESDSNLTGKVGWVCCLNLSIDSGFYICSMVLRLFSRDLE